MAYFKKTTTMKEKKSMCEMSLNEIVSVSTGFNIIRVPGGWIYNIFDIASDADSAIFVPYNVEFQGSPEDLYEVIV